MSPCTFRSLATCVVTIIDAIATHCRKAETLRRRPADAEFFPTSLCPRYCCHVIAEEANVFIAEVFGVN